jgi:TetR/AcrR family transcriptional repressor of nem operon
MTEKPTASGRPAEFSRDDAIEGAMNLFWRDGYLGVSASDLAAAMNIQRSSFYNSFGSRSVVFLEALEHYSKSAPDKVVDALEPGDPVLPTIAAMFRELCRQRAADVEARGCLVCNSVGELIGVDDELGPVLLRAVEDRIDVFERALRQAMDQGELTLPNSVTASARSLVAFLLGINLISKTVRDEQALWETCRSFLEGFGVPEQALDSLAFTV